MYRKFLSGITFFIFVLILAELVVGGGGRLFAFGPVTLRMALFALAMLITGAHLLSGERIPDEFKRIIIAFTIVYVIAILVGILNGASRSRWWEDIKPLLYIFMLPFFFFVFAQEKNDAVNLAATVIRWGSVALALLFFLALILIHAGLVPFLELYHPAIASTEFFFRGEITFFYKGFLYLCIGFIFFHFTGSKSKTMWQIMLLLAIIFTFTRGFLFALALTYALHYFLHRQWLKLTGVTVCALFIVFFGRPAIEYSGLAINKLLQEDVAVLQTEPTMQPAVEHSTDHPTPELPQPPNTTLLGDREYSDRGRLDQIGEVLDRITLTSLLIGHGLGIGIPSRPVHMEISYLEIFHKQGIVGLCFWAWLLLLLFQKFRPVMSSAAATAFFLSSVFVFCQSLTNQYINNPIGLSITILTLVVLHFSNRDHTTATAKLP